MIPLNTGFWFPIKSEQYFRLSNPELKVLNPSDTVINLSCNCERTIDVLRVAVPFSVDREELLKCRSSLELNSLDLGPFCVNMHKFMGNH